MPYSRTWFRAILPVAFVLTLLPGGLVEAQVPDSVRPDSVRPDSAGAPTYIVPGLTVSVARAVTTTGGTSAVEISLDSLGAPPAPTMEQLLREMPLITIRQNSRGEAQPSLRGSEDRQIAVLMDGVPLTLGWDHRTDLSIVPLTAARSVRLVRGLSSVLHGPNVLGGVVEVDVARGAQPLDDPEPLTVSASVDHVGARSMAATGGRALDGLGGSWVVQAGGGYHETPGAVLPEGLGADEGQRPDLLTATGGDLRLNSDSERYDGFFSARYRADGGSWASFATSGFTGERGVPPEAHVNDPRLWRYPRLDRAITAFTAGTGQRETGLGTGDAEVSVGLDLSRTEIESYESPAFDRVTGTEVGDARTLTIRLLGDHTLGDDGEFRTALTYADVAHDEVLDGSELNRYRQRLWSLASEVEWRFGGLMGIPGVGDTRVSAGLALDGSDTPESAGKPPLGALHDWGGRLGFSSLTPGGDIVLHGSVSRRTRFPALRELYSGALGRFEPNPDLRPEELLGGETGVTWTSSDTEIQAVLFHQRLRDGIVRTSVMVDGQPRFQRVNQDEVRSTGLEILASRALGTATLTGDLTLQDVKGLDADGREVELEYEPTVSGSLGLRGPLPWRITGTTDLGFVSDQYCQNPEAGGLEAFDTDPVVDLGLRRTFRPGSRGSFSRIEAVLGVDNVTDAGVFDQCGLPRPGRTFRLQVRLW